MIKKVQKAKWTYCNVASEKCFPLLHRVPLIRSNRVDAGDAVTAAAAEAAVEQWNESNLT